MEIAEKTFLVTGGASGLGAATARLLLARGARVVIGDVRAVSQELVQGYSDRVSSMVLDVTSEEEAQRAIAGVRERFGPLHGLVNCAGVAPSERLAGRNGAHSLASFTRVISINLIGTFNMMRLAAEAMTGNDVQPTGERGVILNTASIAAYEGQIGQVAYAASKAGVVGMTLPAARELARSGIRVVTIAPGIFSTPMMAGFSQEVQDALAQSVPFPSRLGDPQEFAQLVIDICELPMLNGEVIRLDGALRMPPK